MRNYKLDTFGYTILVSKRPNNVTQVYDEDGVLVLTYNKGVSDETICQDYYVHRQLKAMSS